MDKELTSTSIYSMHKYWGKKPPNELSNIISQYSSVGDLILDPFAGFAGFAVEAILQNRNVIINDLNPIAVFIAKTILDYNVNVDKFYDLFVEIKSKYKSFEKEWYQYKDIEILTILRNSNDKPIKIKGKNINTNKMIERELTDDEISDFLNKENAYKIKTWFPKDYLIVNSRISANKNIRICDLFSKRALICQSYLFSLISELEESSEKNLLLLSFTANLANCSKLVPPIKSRGDMAQGAWMTGFYVGDTYLDNNVFHYFENRVGKSKKGKLDYLMLRKQKKVSATYSIMNDDAKKLPIASNSIDFVFTDFPYGDTVPYFEQSQVWNSWLKFNVDYDNEIVISDSIERKKDIHNFNRGIDSAIAEISRTLKENKFFVFTFHSLYGREWCSIVKALRKNKFQYVECDVIIQKTLPPRQINRKHSIKGDIVAVYQKKETSQPKEEFYDVFLKEVDNICIKKQSFETNDLIILCVRSLLKSNTDDDIDFKNIIESFFEIDDTNSWRRKK